MLNSIGLQGPGIDGAPRATRCPRSRGSGCASGSPSAASRRGLRRNLRTPRRARGRRGDRAQPLVPERRGGARVARPRSSPPAASRDVEAALREALAGDLGHRRVGPGGRRGRRGRPLPRQHDPRAGARPRHAPADARPRHRRILGSRAEARSRSRASRRAPQRSMCRSSGWAACAPGSMRSSSSRRAPALSRLAPSSSPIPAAPERIRGELAAEAAARGFAESARRAGSCQWLIRKNPCKSAKTVPLDPARRIARLVRPWSRRRLRPKHPPARSTSGWKRSSGQTTSGSGAHS